jgi:hypothetical protein
MSDQRILSSLSQGDSVVGDAELKNAKNNYYQNFTQMVVLEVISDPKKITPEKILYWKDVLKVGLSWSAKYLSAPLDENAKDFPRVFPRNTVIVQKKLSGETTLTPPTFALPFFPSHLSMPCKAGELVWVMYENPAAGGEKIPYWMCSVVQPYFVEDVNHTHAPMALRKSTLPKSAPADLKMPYQLRNGDISLIQKDGKFVDDKNDLLIVSDEATKFLSSKNPDVFEQLIRVTDASRITSYESIPRFHKRPGDVVLEGSNNTLIALGTDRTGPLGNYVNSNYVTKKETISVGLSPNWPDEDYKQYAGSIDIVAGRGYSPQTGGTTDVEVTEISNPKNVIKKEIDKLNPPPSEGDPDLVNDRSRILISQKTSTDYNFNLEDYFLTTPGAPANVVDTPSGDASIVIKSDKVRIIARSDISFIVTNFEDKSPTDQDRIKDEYKNEVEDTTQWASITIRRNGDIIFKPSDKGLIKLGGDDADKAILCTDNLSTDKSGKPIVKDGIVKYKPGLISTGADLIGTGKPKQGTFATKILVK